ncbi:protein sax-3-like isoform X2 [Anopheles stephensi]|uniref:protein sax-3-like isoform X2 n=1 Tax=Anopheles stephensi TaxID=30069 RepID=UPI00165882CF|nr:protein sax-3-like isoform X2 [Anopheles stephensi]
MNLRSWGAVQLALAFAVVLVGTMVESHALPQSSISVSKEQRNKQEAVESPSDDYDDDYDDDEDVPSQEKPEISDNALLGTNLLTKDYIEEARPSEQVTLKCEVSNPTASTVIMWYYNEKTIFQHMTKVTSDPRYQLNPDFSLQIDNVQLADEGVYSCQLLPNNMIVKIELQVFTPPRDVHIMHGNKILNDTLELHQRDRKFILLCSAKGHPTPVITWSYRGRHLDEEYSRQTGIVLRKEFLDIHEVKPQHAGDYECMAQNGIGDPVSRRVTVVVKADSSSEELEDDDMDASNVTAPLEKGSPIIHKHSSYINTAIGENVEMVCLYDSNPAPRKIQWIRDDAVVQQEAGKITITNDHHNHHSRTRLNIRNVQQKDLQAYFCKIENELGEATSKTILGLQPGGAHLIYSNVSDGLLHTWWKIHSIQQISEMQLLYRGNNTKYTPIAAEMSNQDQNPDGYTWTVRKSIRLPEGEWFVTARARNPEGWSSAESLPHPFQIRDAMANIQVASIGGSSAAHRTLPVLSGGGVLALLLLLLPFVKSLVY